MILSAYHFNTWLIVVNQYLTLDLLDSTTEHYKAMKTNVMSEVNKQTNRSTKEQTKKTILSMCLSIVIAHPEVVLS